jgi:hypothetical protein
MKELVDLRLRRLIDDKGYLEKKRELDEEKMGLEEQVNDPKRQISETRNRSIEVFNFAEKALQVFEKGSQEEKRGILNFTGSNPTILNKNLIITPQKPLELLQDALRVESATKFMFEPGFLGQPKHKRDGVLTAIPRWQALITDVRTYYRKYLFLNRN